jgi:hypothetical protein
MPEEQNLKRLSLVTLTALGILLAGAFLFYKERMFFADASFILFNVINKQTLFIQEHRCGSFITQAFPLLAAKLHLPMRAIVIAYSVSFNIFYLAVAGLVARLRYYGLAIIMGLYYLLFVSDSYFWTNNEIHQAIAWMFLFFAAILYPHRKRASMFLFVPVFILLAALTIFTHFAVIIPFVFLWVYFIIDKSNWPFSRAMSITLSCLIALVIGAKFAITKQHTYDNNYVHHITHFSLEDIFKSFVAPVTLMFYKRCLTNYWMAVILMAIGIFHLLRKGKKKQAIWCIVSFIGYIMIVGMAFCDFDQNVVAFHMETEWQSMGIIAATPFVFSVLPSLKPSNATWVLVVVCVVRLAYIAAAAPPFRERLQFEEGILAQMKHKNISKLALYEKEEFLQKCMLSWAVTYETLLFSAMHEDNPQPTFAFINKDNHEALERLKNRNAFYGVWGMYRNEELNSKYFSIDTTQPYAIMDYEQLFSK